LDEGPGSPDLFPHQPTNLANFATPHQPGNPAQVWLATGGCGNRPGKVGRLAAKCWVGGQQRRHRAPSRRAYTGIPFEVLPTAMISPVRSRARRARSRSSAATPPPRRRRIL